MDFVVIPRLTQSFNDDRCKHVETGDTCRQGSLSMLEHNLEDLLRKKDWFVTLWYCNICGSVLGISQRLLLFFGLNYLL